MCSGRTPRASGQRQSADQQSYETCNASTHGESPDLQVPPKLSSRSASGSNQNRVMKPRPCRVQPRLSDARWGALAFNPKAFGWEVKRTRRCLPALKSSVAFVILVTELPPFAASVRRKRFREDFSYGNANQNHPDWSRFDTTSLSVVRGRRRLSLRGATQNVARS